jgi:hypothetical protein
MVRGQARDLGEPPPETLIALETLHGEKTGALFRAALLVGGYAGGAGPDALAALARYGTAYGVAFQHADDITDEEHAEHAGAARDRLEALVAEACAAIAPLGARGDRLVGLARAFCPRRRRARAAVGAARRRLRRRDAFRRARGAPRRARPRLVGAARAAARRVTTPKRKQAKA